MRANLILFRPDALNIKDEHTKKVLKRYLAILEDKEKPKFKKADLKKLEAQAFEITSKCELCERKCKAARLKGEKGYCRAPAGLRISSIFAHYGEEYFFIPSLTIFFMGCTFSCAFCQNWEISQWYEQGYELSPQELAEAIELHAPECRNINLVGGEPTPYLPWIIQTLKHVKASLPVIWNSNFYMSEKTMKILNEMVDVYLSDWKYGNNACAERLSNAKNYMAVIERNHLMAFESGELVIRHLVLPSHVECCTKPVLERISELFGDKAIVNIMAQYRPEYRAKRLEDISRYPSQKELEEAWSHAEKLGLNWIR